MSDIAIRVEELSKQYRIGARKQRYTTLRDQVVETFTSLWKRNGHRDASRDTIWALRDASFEVNQGEVIGIIGRNGAGKSTLLKILSRITEPTTGRADIYGRVGSLLEVGTGFHEELTGRENIFLNGAILGMSRKEIQRKFDEIVAFAEVENFIDTPVKRYSSGMYVRLAFAVAAHLEPEILIVDEVLAVGDMTFQKKCLGKMGDVAKEGRTVLFVSHNMAAVTGLCSRAIVLQKGQIVFDGPSQQAVSYYLSAQATASQTNLIDRQDRAGNGRIRFVQAWVEDAEGNTVETVCSGQDVRLVAEYQASDNHPLGSLTVLFALNGRMGEQIAGLVSDCVGTMWENAPPAGQVVCRLPRLPLNAGRYSFNVYAYVNDITADWVREAAAFTVIAGDFFGTGRLPSEDQGSFLLDQSWTLEPSSAESLVSDV